MFPKKHNNLVKALLVKDGPENMYPFPMFWMEGNKDLEGFSGSLTYGFVKEPCTFHPMEGAIVHPYDEILVFASRDVEDFMHLGGELTIELGEEREEHVFNTPTAICIPKGMAHGPVKVRNVEIPFVHYIITLSPEFISSAVPKEKMAETVNINGTKFGHLLKPLVWSHDPKTLKPTRDGNSGKGNNDNDNSGMGYSSVVDELGVMHTDPSQKIMGPANADSLAWLYAGDLEGFEVNFTWGHYSKAGKWHRSGEMHTHPEEEILVFVGLDPDDMNNIGAEVELGMGEECERHIVIKPSVYICPKGFPHLPVIVRWVDRPYGFIVCCLSATHDSPWVGEIPYST